MLQKIDGGSCVSLKEVREVVVDLPRSGLLVASASDESVIKNQEAGASKSLFGVLENCFKN